MPKKKKKESLSDWQKIQVQQINNCIGHLQFRINTEGYLSLVHPRTVEHFSKILELTNSLLDGKPAPER